MQLNPGANTALPHNSFVLSIEYGTIPGVEIDISAYRLTSSGKVRGDEDMCFYGQTQLPGGGLGLTNASDGRADFSLDLVNMPAGIEKITFAATIHENRSRFAAVGSLKFRIGEITGVIDCAGREETAMLVLEIYRRNSEWKVRAVGQGFNGGLEPLAKHLGVDISPAVDPAAAPAPAPAPAAIAAGISLEKKLVSLEKRAPEMVSLVKQVGVSLAKHKISQARAKVALVLDISGSMSKLYSSGKIDILVKRIMAFGYAMDDDGDIDVFLFGQRIHDFGTVTVENYQDTVRRIVRAYPLEGGTRYGDAIERVRGHYASNYPEGLPVYVMFVTDGGTDDKPKTERQLRAASAEPLFWKFMAIQEGSGRWDQGRFAFLEKLDDLSGRVVDNADAFSLADPARPSDAEMFDLMMTEYDGWLSSARAAGIIKPLQ